MKEEVKQALLKDLVPDNKNANKGTQYGQHLIENSLRKFGAGRSILIDKNNRIIAGNKTVENAGSIGLDDVIIVETTGDKVVAVKRTDIDLDSAYGRELALADNATSKANLLWDEDVINGLVDELQLDVKEWGIDLEELKLKPTEEDLEFKEKFYLQWGDTKIEILESEKMRLDVVFNAYKQRNGTNLGFLEYLIENK